LKLSRAFAAILLLIFTNTYAWNDTGHMLVASIAYTKLKPDVRTKIDRLVKSLREEYPAINSMAQMAVWPDQLRAQHIIMFTHWHYIDQPIYRDGIKYADTIDDDNAVWALENIKSVINNEHANVYERARMLAFLVHITGDIHQPLHTVTLVSNKFPEGDHGGNDYHISYHGKNIKLHKLWDGGVGAFVSNGHATRHLAAVEDQAEAITARYPVGYFAERLKFATVQDWVKESYGLATQYVYTTEENKAPSAAYLETGKRISEEQVALAGYRLANLLNQLLE